MARQLFYVTQDDLQVYAYRNGGITRQAGFAHGDDGFRAFSDYLETVGPLQSLMLVDVIEEEFFAERMPALGMRDRESLIERRLQKRFPRTSYRIGQIQGKSETFPGEVEALFTAISNPELLDSWLKVATTHKTPLLGIYSVPLLSGEFLRRVCKPAEHALLLGTHQGDRLRQMFLSGRRLKSSRLAKSPDPDDASYAENLAAEIQRSRRYLERGRLLTPRDELHIYLVADEELALRIAESSELSSGTRVHAIDPQVAASKTGLSGPVKNSNIEELYLALATRKRLRNNYAKSGETRYSGLTTMRRLVTASTIAAALACSAVSGVYLTDSLQLRHTTQAVRDQIARLEETYRRENEKFQPLKAGSQEMKAVVDTGEFIVRNTLPTGFVMQQLGQVLGDFPDMHILELEWDSGAVEEDDVMQARRRRSEAPMPIAIPELGQVSAQISGEIIPFDGNLKYAFQRIRDLATALEENTRFAAVTATEFPINDSPAAPLSAEHVRDSEGQPAKFRLNLTMEGPGEQTVD